MNKKKPTKTSRDKDKMGKNSVPKKYQLKGLGWCGEVTAHKLTPAQVKVVKTHAKEEGIDLDGLGNMEDVLEDYNCYDTNLWQSGVLPFLHSSCYALVDSKNKILFSIDSILAPSFNIVPPLLVLIEKIAPLCLKL